MEPLIQLRDVSYSFGSGELRKEVLHEVSEGDTPG